MKPRIETDWKKWASQQPLKQQQKLRDSLYEIMHTEYPGMCMQPEEEQDPEFRLLDAKASYLDRIISNSVMRKGELVTMKDTYKKQWEAISSAYRELDSAMCCETSKYAIRDAKKLRRRVDNLIYKLGGE